MKQRWTAVLVMVLLIGLRAAASTAASTGEKAGTVTRIEKTAVAVQDAIPRPLQDGSDILVGDVISTGRDARLEFKLLDGSVVNLGERTVFVVTDFAQRNDEENIALRLLEGAFKASSGELTKRKPDAMNVETELGSIGIRGTTVWGGHLDKVFQIALLDGKKIVVTTRGGSVELTKPLQGTRLLSADAAPTAPRTWGDEKVTQAAATVDFSK